MSDVILIKSDDENLPNSPIYLSDKSAHSDVAEFNPTPPPPEQSVTPR